MSLLKRSHPAPLVIKDLGNGEALVVSTPQMIASFGDATEEVPSALLQAIGVAMPITEKMAESLSGRLVRLTDESMRLLRDNNIVRVDGFAAGMVRDPKSGQLAGLLTFDKMTLTASAAAALPALAAGAALQMQLARIEKQLESIEGKLDYVIRQGHLQIEARLEMAAQVLEDVASDCLSSGFVDDDAWGRVVAVEDDIRELVIWAVKNLASLSRALSDDDLSLREKIMTLRSALDDDKAEWWLRARVAAEVAVLRWEQLRLMRRAWTTPDELNGVIERVEREVMGRRDELALLRSGLEVWAETGARSHRVLDRLRILKKRRLAKLLQRLPPMLAAYETGIGPQRPALDQTSLNISLVARE